MIVLHILLWILKIIGILLLVLLGILILGIMVLLFVPVRYEGKIKGDLSDLNGITGFAKLGYFFNLVGVTMQFSGKAFDWEAHIAWKRFGDKAESEEAGNDLIEITIPEEPEKMKEPEGEKQSKKMEKSEKSENILREKPKKNVSRKPEMQEEKNENLKKNVRKKRSLAERMCYIFERFCDKIKSLSRTKEKIEQIYEKGKDFIQNEIHKKAFFKVKKVIFGLLRKWMPRKAESCITFGFEDPYYTGKVLAYLAMVYPFFGQWLQIIPDFEQAALKGNLYLKGHIRLNHLVFAGIRILADKNIRMTVKEILEMRRGRKKEEK